MKASGNKTGQPKVPSKVAMDAYNATGAGIHGGGRRRRNRKERRQTKQALKRGEFE